MWIWTFDVFTQNEMQTKNKVTENLILCMVSYDCNCIAIGIALLMWSVKIAVQVVNSILPVDAYSIQLNEIKVCTRLFDRTGFPWYTSFLHQYKKPATIWLKYLLETSINHILWIMSALLTFLKWILWWRGTVALYLKNSIQHKTIVWVLSRCGL